MSDADRQYWHGPLAPMARAPHPTDRREAKRGMIRAMLCFVVGMYLFAVLVS